jgi:hypothetical protein
MMVGFKRGRSGLYLLLDKYRTMCLQNVAESGNAAVVAGVSTVSVVRLEESHSLVALSVK